MYVFSTRVGTFNGAFAVIHSGALSDFKARWTRSGIVARGAVVLLGPVSLFAWGVSVLAAKYGAQAQLRPISFAVGAAQAVLLFAAAAFYVERVRLWKGSDWTGPAR